MVEVAATVGVEVEMEVEVAVVVIAGAGAGGIASHLPQQAPIPSSADAVKEHKREGDSPPISCCFRGSENES